jgi:pyrroline-5-carboxylate reductase
MVIQNIRVFSSVAAVLSNSLKYSYIPAGGVRVGLSRSDAVKLAAQTVKGAAEMVLSTGSSPAVLKDQGTVQSRESAVLSIW